MQQDQLYQTAIHEAGHAVISAILGKGFKNVSIKSRSGEAGRMMPWGGNRKLREQLQGTNTTKEWKPETIDKKVRNEIASYYAGYFAQFKTGVDNTWGASSDFTAIGNLAMAYKGEGNEVESFLNECREATQQLINSNWHHITAVANQLIDKKALTGKEVIQIIVGK